MSQHTAGRGAGWPTRALTSIAGVVVALGAFSSCSDPDPVQAASPAATSTALAAAPANSTPTRAESSDTPPAALPPPQSTTEVATPASGTQSFVNSPGNLDGTLAENYVDFSFSYPSNWTLDPEGGKPGAANFVKVTHDIDGGFTIENFAVGWFGGTGTAEGDAAVFPAMVAQLSNQFQPAFPGYRKISEGATRIGSHDGYELRFESTVPDTEKGTLTIWVRAVLIPGAGSTRGVTIVMMATNLSPDVDGIDEVGVKGELPLILDSFKLGE